MKILRFTLSGKQAFFKKPDVNTYYYFTFGHIHKVALLGIFGAILGYSGYGQKHENDSYPEFYEKLKDIQLSIIPNTVKGGFVKKIVSFNNSVGYASKEQGGNLVVKEQWIEEPSWDVYILLNSEQSKKIAEYIMKNQCIYMPYLGTNDHPADITNAVIINGEVLKNVHHIDSFCLKETVKIDIDDADEQENPFKYEETLPIELDELMNQYIYKKFVLTNMLIEKCNSDVYVAFDEKMETRKQSVNIVFY